MRPEWKSQYASSVRRLVRDGVDSPLANLFVGVAVTPLRAKEGYPNGGVVISNAEGANRARSASEAFLYRRLETLATTAGKSRLNAKLPIPFDGWGHMEVDLLCAPSRIAIELDGGQHLGDADAYRRDRRKDALLQENGYLVLRFLAEDVGRYLDQVLDAILRALSHQDSKTFQELMS
jgi:very-short-patch-repair endonuclease